MPFGTESAPTPSVNTRLIAPTTAELAADHARKVQEFLNSTRKMTREAKKNGLTEEILASILAEK